MDDCISIYIHPSVLQLQPLILSLFILCLYYGHPAGMSL